MSLELEFVKVKNITDDLTKEEKRNVSNIAEFLIKQMKDEGVKAVKETIQDSFNLNAEGAIVALVLVNVLEEYEMSRWSW